MRKNPVIRPQFYPTCAGFCGYNKTVLQVNEDQLYQERLIQGYGLRGLPPMAT